VLKRRGRMDRMKAVRLVEPGRPLEVQEIDVPEVGPTDVLVRVKAAGICHSDVHYRKGTSAVHPLPLTLGHEVAGVVDRVGSEVTELGVGDRVCLHYLVTCGKCVYCNQGHEQFCPSGAMIGKHRDGGYAEFCAVPSRCAFPLPNAIPFEQGAIMMCSSATANHALLKSRLRPGESVAVFGMGGLGMSAVQLAKAFGALRVFAIDIRDSKLETAKGLGATPINGKNADPVTEIKRLTDGEGVDVALELIGIPRTMEQAIKSLGTLGRAVLAGITEKSFTVTPYEELLCKEAEVIGVSDHLAQELPLLIGWVSEGKLDLAKAIARTVALDADPINEVLDRIEQGTDEIRVVITP
jgi:propanol-preferring alcohol dehydrogenase